MPGTCRHCLPARAGRRWRTAEQSKDGARPRPANAAGFSLAGSCRPRPGPFSVCRRPSCRRLTVQGCLPAAAAPLKAVICRRKLRPIGSRRAKLQFPVSEASLFVMQCFVLIEPGLLPVHWQRRSCLQSFRHHGMASKKGLRRICRVSSRTGSGCRSSGMQY